MHYISHYNSPIGKITLASDGTALTGLWFDGHKKYASVLEKEHKENSLPIFDKTTKWLDIYFSGKNPDFTPKVEMLGTPFQKAVWRELLKIPYGETITYGEVAKRLAKNGRFTSPRAVGSAASCNPISIIVPCHRVIGKNGSLTGYAGGIDKKIKLQQLEGIDTSSLLTPK